MWREDLYNWKALFHVYSYVLFLLYQKGFEIIEKKKLYIIFNQFLKALREINNVWWIVSLRNRKYLMGCYLNRISDQSNDLTKYSNHNFVHINSAFFLSNNNISFHYFRYVHERSLYVQGPVTYKLHSGMFNPRLHSLSELHG